MCADSLSGDPIRVGMAMDFSDVVGFVDIPGSNLVPYVAEKINCSGGIGGAPVEVRVAEVGDDAALAAAELLDWGAHFLIGPPFADFALRSSKPPRAMCRCSWLPQPSRRSPTPPSTRSS